MFKSEVTHHKLETEYLKILLTPKKKIPCTLLTEWKGRVTQDQCIKELVSGGGGTSPDAGALAWPSRASASMHQGKGGVGQEAGQQGGCLEGREREERENGEGYVVTIAVLRVKGRKKKRLISRCWSVKRFL